MKFFLVLTVLLTGLTAKASMTLECEPTTNVQIDKLEIEVRRLPSPLNVYGTALGGDFNEPASLTQLASNQVPPAGKRCSINAPSKWMRIKPLILRCQNSGEERQLKAIRFEGGTVFSPYPGFTAHVTLVNGSELSLADLARQPDSCTLEESL